jgi:hypothetical protein
MKFEHLIPGMVVFEIRQNRMGNTTMKSWGTYQIKIFEVDPVKRRVLASWNSNASEWFGEFTYKKWKKEKPFLVKYGMGFGYRKPTREELAEYKDKKNQGGV